jgi:hypothetical protein
MYAVDVFECVVMQHFARVKRGPQYIWGLLKWYTSNIPLLPPMVDGAKIVTLSVECM